MAKIINSGLAYLRDKVQAGAGVEITQAIFCNLPGLDYTAEIPDTTIKPNTILQTVDLIPGAINSHSVVFSAALTAEMGNFSFNWVGLIAKTGELIAVETYPEQEKYKSENQTVGNTLVKNIVLQFDNAAAITEITTSAETWQCDFTSEFLAARERERIYNRDLYSGNFFWGDAFKVYRYAGKLKIKAGVGYVEGVRIVSTGAELETTNDNDIWVEAFNENQVTGTTGRFVIHSRNDTPADFIDGYNQQHYFFKLAEITAGPNIENDNRIFVDQNGLPDLFNYFDEKIQGALDRAEAANQTAANADQKAANAIFKADNADQKAASAIQSLNGVTRFYTGHFSYDDDDPQDSIVSLPEGWTFDWGQGRSVIITPVNNIKYASVQLHFPLGQNEGDTVFYSCNTRISGTYKNEIGLIFSAINLADIAAGPYYANPFLSFTIFVVVK